MTATNAAPAPAAAAPTGTMLASVKKGKHKKPHLVLIYGPDGVGKSSFAAGAPKCIFVGPEDGNSNLDVSAVPGINSFQAFMRALGELLHEKHEYLTLAVDSLDWMENMVYDEVCKEKNVKSIEDIGYGKGYQFALDKWRVVMEVMKRLREERNMNIVLIAHAKIKKFEDPNTPQGYERYQLKLQTGANTDAAALWREFVDTVLFANFETFTSAEDKKRAFGEGTRVMFTERRPAFDAKNRAGLPFKLPLSWEDFSVAMAKGQPEEPGTLKERIAGLVPQVKNKELVPVIQKTITEAGDDAVKLSAIANRLEAIIGREG